MTKVEAIKKVLEDNNGIATWKIIYDEIEKYYPTAKESIEWSAGIRGVVYREIKNNRNFKKIDESTYSLIDYTEHNPILSPKVESGRGVGELRSEITNTPKAEDLGEVEEKTNLPERVKTEIYRVLRDTTLTKKIKLLYQDECQICNQKIKLQKNNYSEAHHIKPLGRHKGPDSADNIIILCPNHHVEFDYGVIAINPNTLEIAHKNNKDTLSLGSNATLLARSAKDVKLDFYDKL
ncbi:MAG: HNH endonuclease [Candidatus Shapirobacteria bacterium]